LVFLSALFFLLSSPRWKGHYGGRKCEMIEEGNTHIEGESRCRAKKSSCIIFIVLSSMLSTE